MATHQSRRDFAELLDKTRHERHLSIRAAARIAGVPAATVQGWLSGKHFPVPALRPSYLKLVEALDLSNRLPADLWSGMQPQLRAEPAPYLGLRPFTAADRDLFFGRERESRRLAETVQRQWREYASGVVVVLGASGAGKSSLLAAGLIGQETVDGTLAGWAVEGLSVSELLEVDGPSVPLVVVDQFEELFVLDSTERSAAMARLSDLASRSVVVVGLRADAFGRASQEPVLASALEHPFLVSPLSRQEARDIIVRPAELAGVAVDEALVPVLLDDLAPGPSDSAIAPDALPLLSNSLLVTWAAGHGSRISLDDYLDSGGMAGALQTLAEEVFASLDPGQRKAAQALLLRMVRITGDVVASESVTLPDIGTASRAALDSFVAARMFTVHGDLVGISHDALLNHWPRLREWIDAARVDLAVVSQLRTAAHVWQDSGRSSDALIPVERIEVFSEWMGDPRSLRLLGPLEREFVAASRDHFDSELAKERALTRRLRRGRSMAVVLMALTTTFALVAGGLYFRAVGLQALADTARLESQSRQVALEAQSLRADDLNLMGQMSLVAANLAETRQSVSTLLDATSVNVPVRWLGHGSAVVAASPDSSVVARADGKGGVTLWRRNEITTSRGSTFQADPSGAALYAIAIASSNHRLMLAVGGTAVAQLWDVTTEPRLIQDLHDGAGTVKSLGFDATGRTLAVGTSSGKVSLWDIGETPSARKAAEVEIDPVGATVRHEAVGLRVAAGCLFVAGLPNAVGRWTLVDGRKPRRLQDLGIDYTGSVNSLSLAINPAETELAVGIRGRRVFRWRLAGSEATPLRRIEVGGWTNAVAYSADGRTLLAGSADQNVYVFDAESARLRSRLFDAHSVTGVAWASGRPVSVGDDGTLRVWQSRSPVTSVGSAIYSLSSDRREQYVAAASLYDGIQLWKRHGQRLDPMRVLKSLGRDTSAAVAIAPSGTFIVGGTTGTFGELISWRLDDRGASSPRAVRAFPKGSYVGALAVSPDSTVVAALEYTGQHVALFRANSNGDLTPVSMLDTPIPQGVSFSSDGRTLAVPLAEERVQLWDVSEPGHPTLVGQVPNPGSPALAAALSPAGNLLAVGESSGQVTVWDVSRPDDPAKIRTFRDPLAAITMVAFSEDGAQLAASGGDRYVWLWHLGDTSDTAKIALGSDSSRTWDLRFMDNGHQLIAGGEGAELRSWLLLPRDAQKVLCSSRGDALTSDEWSRYLPGVEIQDPCR